MTEERALAVTFGGVAREGFSQKLAWKPRPVWKEGAAQVQIWEMTALAEGTSSAKAL